MKINLCFPIGISSLVFGFDALNVLPGGMSSISNHTFKLAVYAVKQLREIRHFNGEQVVTIYGGENMYLDPDNIASQGGIVNFNLLAADGNYIGFSSMKTLCDLSNIVLRYKDSPS